MTHTEAIARSISHNEIVRLEYAKDTHDDLLAECDDCTEANGEFEFWGTDEAGNEWRVHMAEEFCPLCPDNRHGAGYSCHGA